MAEVLNKILYTGEGGSNPFCIPSIHKWYPLFILYIYFATQNVQRKKKEKEKVQKKIVKSCLESYNKCFTSEIFLLLIKSYSILLVHVHLQCIVDKALFLLFLRSLLLTCWIISSLEKEIIVLEKVWKKSGILDPKFCAIPGERD